MNGRSSGLDAIRVLKRDHRKVEAWFKQWGQAVTDTQRRDLALKICTTLRIHAQIEEEIFYPAFLELTKDRDRHHEAIVEHAVVQGLIEEIERSDPGDEFFAARMTVLAELIKYHVKEEEKPDGMFAAARKAGMDLQWVGRTLQMRKLELGDRRAAGAGTAVDAA